MLHLQQTFLLQHSLCRQLMQKSFCMLLSMFLNKKEQTSFCLFYSFDFDVVFSSAFSVISTTVRVIMKPPMKNSLSILSPPNAKIPQSILQIVGYIVLLYILSSISCFFVVNSSSVKMPDSLSSLSFLNCSIISSGFSFLILVLTV